MNLDLSGYGPLMINKTSKDEIKLIPRPINWNQYNLLFIDYSIALGTSYVEYDVDIP